MIRLTAAEVAAATGGRLAADPGTVVDGPVVIDSRSVQPGSLFVALPGERVDGHDYAGAAASAGAALVLAGRPVGVPAVLVEDPQAALGLLAAEVLRRLRSGLTVVAVTGSYGKTTTKDLLAHLLSGLGSTVAPVGSFNNEIGMPLTVLQVDAATRYLVLEMGASAVGNLTYLTGIAPPDVAVVLAVGAAHLGQFGSIEAVARAKGELVEGLTPGGTAVLNADDERVAAMAGRAAGPIVTFGRSAAADVRAADVGVDAAGRAHFRLETPDGSSHPVALGLVGEHHLHNALAAAAVAVRLGMAPEQAARRLSGTGPASPHRMHVVDRADGVTVVDDAYNANPGSVRAALRTLATLAGRDRRSVAVLGEMRELGAASRAEHEAIGLQVVRLNIALTVVVGPAARAIAAGAVREGSWGEEVVTVDDVDAAATFLRDELRPGDVVLVKASFGAGLWRLADRLVADPVGA